MDGAVMRGAGEPVIGPGQFVRQRGDLAAHAQTVIAIARRGGDRAPAALAKSPSCAQRVGGNGLEASRIDDSQW